MVSQANGEGLVILPSDLSARCIAEALLFASMIRQRGYPFGLRVLPTSAPSTSLWPIRSSSNRLIYLGYGSFAPNGHP